MLIFDREVDRGDREKTREKNAVYVESVIALGANFGRRPIRFVDLIEQEFALFNRFCVWPS